MKRELIYISVIVVLLVLLAVLFFTNNRKEVSDYGQKSDTVYVERIDTIFRSKPLLARDTILDTINVLIVPETGLKVPKTQRLYIDTTYKAWVSGYEPKLDSIYTYNKTVFRTITNTITIKPKTTDFFIGAGIGTDGQRIIPSVNFSVKFKNDIFVGADAGYKYYGLKIGYKL